MKYMRGCEIKQIDIAQDFYDVYQRCWASDEDRPYLSIPAFVNGFFACEIYLKILTNNSTTGHNLYLLFDKLDDAQKDKLRDSCIGVKPEKLSFDELLKKVKSGFEYWRYIYEKDNKQFEEKYPFLYSEEFLHTFLPILKDLAEKHQLKKANK